MSLTPKEIIQIAKLARLKIDSEQASFYANQLSQIINLVEQMNNIDTNDIEPMSHPQDMALRLREDVASAENHRELFQSIAPAVEEGLYLVPKVID